MPDIGRSLLLQHSLASVGLAPMPKVAAAAFDGVRRCGLFATCKNVCLSYRGKTRALHSTRKCRHASGWPRVLMLPTSAVAKLTPTVGRRSLPFHASSFICAEPRSYAWKKLPAWRPRNDVRTSEMSRHLAPSVREIARKNFLRYIYVCIYIYVPMAQRESEREFFFFKSQIRTRAPWVLCNA